MCIVGEAGYVCPVQQHSGGFDQYVARGRNQIAKAILNGELEYSEELMEAHLPVWDATAVTNNAQEWIR